MVLCIQELNYIYKKSPLQKVCKGLSKKAATYSPTNAVPSALSSLTSLFGMGRGEPRCYNHLKLLIRNLIYNRIPNQYILTY